MRSRKSRTRMVAVAIAIALMLVAATPAVAAGAGGGETPVGECDDPAVVGTLLCHANDMANDLIVWICEVTGCSLPIVPVIRDLYVAAYDVAREVPCLVSSTLCAILPPQAPWPDT